MKKKILFITLIILLAGTITALANYTYEQNEIQKYQEATSFEIEQVNETEANRITKMANYIKELNYDITKINEIIFDYAYIVQIYRPNNEQMDYIDSLIYDGADIEDIILIHKFWLTTSDNVSIIGDIYALKDNIDDTYWIEEVFNQITNNKHGVLDSNGIKEYMDKGLVVSDIHTANEMCRAGVLTINEILDMRVDGVSWNEIVKNIEVVNTKTATVEESYVILTALEMSQKTDIAISDYIMNDNAVDNINDMAEDVSAKTNQDVFVTLTSLGVLIDPLSENENNVALIQELKNKILENGISENELNELMSEGYMLMNILNASEVIMEKDAAIRDILNNGGEF